MKQHSFGFSFQEEDDGHAMVGIKRFYSIIALTSMSTFALCTIVCEVEENKQGQVHPCLAAQRIHS